MNSTGAVPTLLECRFYGCMEMIKNKQVNNNTMLNIKKDMKIKLGKGIENNRGII